MHNPFRYFNSSPEVIRLAVMMYVRYPLSLRQVEDLLCERGIDICHETVRYWWNRFGPLFAAEIGLGAQLAISVNNCPPPRDPRSRMTSFKRTQRKYVQKAYRVRKWREYETGLRARGSLTVWLGLTDGKLANWTSPRPTRRKPGRQRKYSNHAIATTGTLGVVFGLASRQTEGFLRSLLTLLNLDNDVPDHSTISRRKARLGKVASSERRTVKPREARPPPHRQQRSFSARRPVAHSAESQGLPQAAPRCG